MLKITHAPRTRHSSRNSVFFLYIYQVGTTVFAPTIGSLDQGSARLRSVECLSLIYLTVSHMTMQVFARPLCFTPTILSLLLYVCFFWQSVFHFLQLPITFIQIQIVYVCVCVLRVLFSGSRSFVYCVKFSIVICRKIKHMQI